MAALARGRHTWSRTGGGGHPDGIYRLRCGCWWDGYADRMWEPCMAHESEGHVSAVSVDQEGGASVARCLVRDCFWRTEQAREAWAVSAAQQHWEDTRQQQG